MDINTTHTLIYFFGFLLVTIFASVFSYNRSIIENEEEEEEKIPLLSEHKDILTRVNNIKKDDKDILQQKSELNLEINDLEHSDMSGEEETNTSKIIEIDDNYIEEQINSLQNINTNN